MIKKDINDAQDKIIEEFTRFQDWFEVYKHLIDRGKKLEPLEESLKTQENMINGCQSQVWVHAENLKDAIHFTADSESLLIKGMISLLLRVLDNQHPKDIVNADLYFIDQIGLKSHLSPSRSNGLMSIINQIKTLSETTLGK